MEKRAHPPTSHLEGVLYFQRQKIFILFLSQPLYYTLCHLQDMTSDYTLPSLHTAHPHFPRKGIVMVPQLSGFIQVRRGTCEAPIPPK